MARRKSLFSGTFAALVAFLALNVLTATAQDAPPPERAVVLDPNIIWRNASSWASGLATQYVWDAVLPDSHLFGVGTPDRRCVWINYFPTPISSEEYPIMVLTYKAQSTAETNEYVLWVDDTTGPNGGGITIARSNDLVPDGKVHDYICDLRNLNPAGNIIGAAAVHGRTGTDRVKRMQNAECRVQNAEWWSALSHLSRLWRERACRCCR